MVVETLYSLKNMTKKEEPRKYAKNREEYFREFHRVIAPVVVLKVEGKND